MTSPKIFMVVGASRGIGRELVTQLAQYPDTQVIATVRKPVDFGLPNVKVITLDQSSSQSVEAAAKQVKEVDTLIMNAAIGKDDLLLSTSEKLFQEYLDTNVVGFLRVVQAFLPALRARQTRQIAFISSTSGSIEQQVNSKFGFMGPYSVAKAAGNMMVVQLHNELHEKEGFVVIAIHPGWVATDMGNLAGDGAMPIPKSAEGVLKVVRGLQPQSSATFVNYEGSKLPW